MIEKSRQQILLTVTCMFEVRCKAIEMRKNYNVEKCKLYLSYNRISIYLSQMAKIVKCLYVIGIESVPR